MALTFDRVINLTTHAGNIAPTYVPELFIANEADNNINQYYIYQDQAHDKNSKIDHSNYGSLSWSGPNNSITSQFIKRLGVKNFPQYGAIAFYTLLHEERSLFLFPVFVKGDRHSRPGFTITQGATTLTFTMTEPSDITYLCWRIVLRTGNTAFEYRSYMNTLTVDKPYLTGTYDCYCIGYAGEGQVISEDSEHITMSITGTGEDPLDKFEYYTKHEIDAKRPVVLNTTLTVAGWQGTEPPYSQTVSLTGVALTGFTYVASPAASDWSNYCKFGLYMSDPDTANSVTFYAISDKPDVALSVNILKMEVQT